MQLNLKTGLLTLIAAISLVACSESYPGLIYDEPGNKVVNEEGLDSATLVPLYVYVNKQSFFTATATPSNGMAPIGTRGIGPFQPITSPTDEAGNPIIYTAEDTIRYYQTNFRIFAFRDGKYATIGSAYPAELANEPNMTWTRLAEDASGHRDEDKLNCLVDGYSFYEGLSSHLDDKSGLITEVKAPLFYGTYQDVGYNFFAYVSDDLETSANTVHRTQDSIYYNDITIDGTQDVMCGYAPKLTDEVLRDRYSQVVLTDAERNRILNIGNYSTYAAHRNIDPYVDIYHQLTRLQFRIFPGDETATATTVDSIYIDAPNTGRLIVAHRDPSRVGLYMNNKVGRYYLHEKPEIVDSVIAGSTVTKRMLRNCNILTAGKYRVEWKEKYWQNKAENVKVPVFERDYIDLGGSIMLPQSSEFVITICSTFTTPEGEEKKAVSHYRVTAESLGEIPENWDETTQQYVFKRARYYTINLVVYGLQPIQVAANIESWQAGGDIYIDPDD